MLELTAHFLFFQLFTEMMKEYEKDAEKSTPELADILKLGANKEEAYDAFCEFILPAVVGRKSRGSKFIDQKISEVATVSDEAMALLFLENSWDKWMARVANANNFLELPRSKYSHDGSGNATQVHHGWKSSGMTRFKELLQLVAIDRGTEVRREFEVEFLARKQESANKRRRITYSGSEEGQHVIIPNDLELDLLDLSTMEQVEV